MSERVLEDKRSKEKYQAPEPPSMHGPGPRPFQGFTGKAKLDHPRGVLWRWILSYLKPHKRIYIFFIGLLLLATVIFSITPLLSSQIIDRGIVGGDREFFVRTVIVYVTLMWFNAIINWLASYGMSRIGQSVVLDIRNELFSQLQDMSMAYYDLRPSGDIISVMTNDVDQLNQLVGGQFMQILSSGVSIVLTIVVMYILNPILATLSLIFLPIFFILIKGFQKRVTGVFKETRRTISVVTSSIQDNVAGAKVIQAYGQQKKASDEFDVANKANYKANVKARMVFATFFPLTNLISTILTVSILLTGAFLALRQVSFFGIVVSIGVLTAFIGMLAEYFRPFMMLMQIQQITESSLAASDRIYKLLEERVEIKDPENPKALPAQPKGEIEFVDVSFGYILDSPANDGRKQGNTGNKTKNNGGSNENNGPKFMNSEPMSPEMIFGMAKELEKMLQNQSSLKSASMGGSMGGDSGMGGGMGKNRGPAAQVMLKMLASMSIPQDILEQIPKIIQDAIKEQTILLEHEKAIGYIIEHMNLKIPAGTTLAIVGETGAGKTTSIKLISRFYDIQEGQIKIDGLDIREIKKKDVRRLMGLVPQDAFLFTGSIRENLLYGIDIVNLEIEQKMLDISKFLGLHNFIETLPEKYNTHLNENAANISIGQRQLIAFARALITDPIILMLDEATSSVDPYTETLIQDALDKARKGRTTIIIAHRLSTIKNADHIIVLGKETHGIVEEGSHEELMAKNGKYRRLLEMQRREIDISQSITES